MSTLYSDTYYVTCNKIENKKYHNLKILTMILTIELKKIKKYHTVNTIPKSIIKIAEKGKNQYPQHKKYMAVHFIFEIRDSNFNI